MTHGNSVTIAEGIKTLLDAASTGITATTAKRYGLPADTAVITQAKAYGIAPLGGEYETATLYGPTHKTKWTYRFRLWAYAKPDPPTSAWQAQQDACDLMDVLMGVLEDNHTLGGLVDDISGGLFDYGYQEIQAGVYAATAEVTLTAVKYADA